jgi:hypothetical protein
LFQRFCVSLRFISTNLVEFGLCSLARNNVYKYKGCSWIKKIYKLKRWKYRLLNFTYYSCFFSQELLIIVLNNCIDLFILRLLWLLIEERLLWLLIEERDWGSLGGNLIRCKLLVVFSVEFRILLVFCIIDIIV